MINPTAVSYTHLVVVQSMTCTPTVDADATLAQVNALVDAGCDLVRVTVPSREALGPFERICHEMCIRDSYAP